MLSHSNQVVGNLYNIPGENASVDLVVASASFPLFAAERDVKDAINEVARVLKKGGEFVLDSGSIELAAPGAVAHLMGKFEVADSYKAGIGCRILILRKK